MRPVSLHLWSVLLSLWRLHPTWFHWSTSSHLWFHPLWPGHCLAGLMPLFSPYPAWKRYMLWTHLWSAVRLPPATARSLADKPQPTRQPHNTTWTTCFQYWHTHTHVYYFTDCVSLLALTFGIHAQCHMTAAVDNAGDSFLVMTGMIIWPTIVKQWWALVLCS